MTDRELDLLVAQHVFGANLAPTKHIDMFSWYPDARGFCVFRCTLCDATWKSLDAIVGDCPNSVSTPAFSTTGDGMLSVIERMRKRGFKCDMRIGPKTNKLIGTALYNVAFQTDLLFLRDLDPKNSQFGHCNNEYGPRAVAIAALRALGVEV